MGVIAIDLNINQPSTTWGWIAVSALILGFLFITTRGTVAAGEVLSGLIRKGLTAVVAIAALLALAAYSDNPDVADTEFRLGFFGDADPGHDHDTITPFDPNLHTHPGVDGEGDLVHSHP